MSQPPKLTREEFEARQQARGEATIDTVRDFMLVYPELAPEEAAFQLWHMYPQYSYEATLKATRLVQSVFELVEKNKAEQGQK